MDPKNATPREKLKLLIVLFVVVFLAAGFHIASRLAINIGVSKVVFLVYRNIIALLFLGPLAYFLEKKERPPLTISLLIKFFFFGLLGVTGNQGLYFLGLTYISSTLASTMQNAIPAYAFLMAAVLRLEQVHFMRRDGMAKIMGTMASVGGSTIITLYKGPPLLTGTNSSAVSTTPENTTLGCVYFIFQCLIYAAWMVLQAPMVKKYPAKLSFVSFTCFFGLIQFLVIAAFTERDPKHWRIQSSEEVLLILYTGVINSGIVVSLMTWSIQKGGPVFVATFQPAQTILVAIMAYLLLGDQLYTGGILGGILIVAGLYLVLWGKTEEAKFSIYQDNEAANLREHLLDHKNAEEHPVTVHDPCNQIICQDKSLSETTPTA